MRAYGAVSSFRGRLDMIKAAADAHFAKHPDGASGTVPVLIDDEGGIIAGHGRVLAAHKLAIAEVPVMVAAGWSEAQKRAYVL